MPKGCDWKTEDPFHFSFGHGNTFLSFSNFSVNWHIISCRYHAKTSFPSYTERIADRCSGLGLSSGLSNQLRAYERQRSGSFASSDVCEKSSAVLLLHHTLLDVCLQYAEAVEFHKGSKVHR